jgi:hypothetical protein
MFSALVMRRKLVSRILAGVTLTAAAVMLTATLARANPDQLCNKGRYDAAATYAKCEMKASAKL